MVVWVCSVPDEIDKDLREIIAETKGKLKRGDLKEAILEAVRDYIRKKRQGQ